MTTVTVLPGPERRRRWTTAERLRIVEESLNAGISVVEFARQRDLHPKLEEGVAESNGRAEQAENKERASPARVKPTNRQPAGRKPLPVHLPRERSLHQPGAGPAMPPCGQQLCSGFSES